MCAQGHACVHVWGVGGDACGGQRTTLTKGPQDAIYPFFESRFLNGLVLASRPGWLSSKPQEHACLCFSVTESKMPIFLGF